LKLTRFIWAMCFCYILNAGTGGCGKRVWNADGGSCSSYSGLSLTVEYLQDSNGCKGEREIQLLAQDRG
jgi:hypothetical protein